MPDTMTDTVGAGMGPTRKCVAGRKFPYCEGLPVTEPSFICNACGDVKRLQDALTAEQARACALREALERLIEAVVDDPSIELELFEAEAGTPLKKAREALTDSHTCIHEEQAAELQERLNAAIEASSIAETGRLNAEAERDRLAALVADGIEAFRITREYVGEGLLPEHDGWAWYDWTQRAAALTPTNEGAIPPADETGHEVQ